MSSVPFPRTEAEYRALIGFDPEQPDWVPTYEHRLHGPARRRESWSSRPCWHWQGRSSCSGWREPVEQLGAGL